MNQTVFIKVLKILSIGSLTIAMTLIGLWKLSSIRDFQLFGEWVTRVPTDAKVVALTFDDGPTPEYTQPVLDTLAKYDVKATFFVTGAETDKHLTEAQKIVQAGHELSNHSYTHPRLIFKSPALVAQELERTDAAIRKAGWQGPIHFRPPFGKRLFVLPWYLAQHKRLTVMWDIEPESYPALTSTPEALAQYVVERAQPGSVILLHLMYKSRENSRQALPLIIEKLKKKGYGFATFSELLKLQSNHPNTLAKAQ